MRLLLACFDCFLSWIGGMCCLPSKVIRSNGIPCGPHITSFILKISRNPKPLQKPEKSPILMIKAPLMEPLWSF